MRNTPTTNHPVQSSVGQASDQTDNTESARPQKSRLKLWLVIGSATLAVGISSIAIAQIRNSVHDFSTSGKGGKWGSATIDEVCVFCHTPHKAISQTMIWNHQMGQTNFTLYSNPGSMVTTPIQPTTYSLRCLACHDGSVAIDALNNVGGRQPVPAMMAIGDVYYPGSPYGSGGANIGGNYSGNANVNNLSDDHPVSILYDNAAYAASQGRLKDPSTLATLPAPLPLFGGATPRVECSTCHDVHNNSGGLPYLLRVTVSKSQLCLSCHNK
jgi:predicted CXXCH cytochrome family protein